MAGTNAVWNNCVITCLYDDSGIIIPALIPCALPTPGKVKFQGKVHTDPVSKFDV